MMPPVHVSLCSEIIQRHAERLRVNMPNPWDIEFMHVVTCEVGVRALAVIAIDLDWVTVAWGSTRDAIRSITSIQTDDAHCAEVIRAIDESRGITAIRSIGKQHSDDGERVTRILWGGLGNSNYGRTLKMETIVDVELPREMPGLYVFSSPTHRHHLLVKDLSSVGDPPDTADPHIIAEVGISVQVDTEPVEWHLCTITVSNSSITLDPPVACWWRSNDVNNDNRTLRVRLADHDGIPRDLVPPGVVRTCKLIACGTDIYSAWEGGWRVEVIERISFGLKYSKMHPDEYRAVAGLADQVVGISSRAAKVIQKAWRRAVTDPSYRVCKNRLLMEFGKGIVV